MKPRVLITGMTGANVRGQMVKTGVYTQSHMYREGLRELGYDVANREPDIGGLEYQVDTNEIFLIGLAPVGSITAGWRIPLLALLGMAIESGRKIITFVDDWQFQSIIPSLQNLMIDDKLSKMAKRDVQMNRLGINFFYNYERQIKLGLEYILDRDHDMLASMMDFGHDNAPYYQLSDRPIFIDPSCLQPIPELPTPEVIFKQWVIAGLADYSEYVKSLGCKWPVIKIGEKIGKFVSQKETEVFNAYIRSKGMLIPNYKASHTNWWRPRYLFARKYGNIVYAEPGSTGKFENFNIHPTKVEKMSNSDLIHLRDTQHRDLDHIVWPKSRFLEVLASSVED